MMRRVAIIGAGVSGLSVARFLSDHCQVTVFEKENCPGGLIRCRRVNGSLFHICGGHVFNSKRQDVLDWFWSQFDIDKEFVKTDRNSIVYMENGLRIPYPIENHVYLFDQEIQDAFYEDLNEIDRIKGLNASFSDYKSFGDFLRWRFGKTLYGLYFQPYNEKVWRRDLSSVPMSWMEGKLPMPSTQEMRENNANRVEEKAFVHSTFWYEKMGGSQFIADRLAAGLDIRYNTSIDKVSFSEGKWFINGYVFDFVVFCGNIKDMVKMVEGVDINSFVSEVSSFESHGTTSVFCEIDENPYSWIYQPSKKHNSHRIICTGNFSPTNNGTSVPQGRITATVEFTDYIDKKGIIATLDKLPFNPHYIDHQYNKYSYPIQNADTRDIIKRLKETLAPKGFFFTGRFADWEYYNMDVAIGAAKDLCGSLLGIL